MKIICDLHMLAYEEQLGCPYCEEKPKLQIQIDDSNKTQISGILTYDFGAGPVPAHQHINPDGTTGGWVANTATVDPTAFIGLNALVYENAQVTENATLSGYPQIKGHAIIKGRAFIRGHSVISGTAVIYDKASVEDTSLVYGNARIYGKAVVVSSDISNNAKIFDLAKVANSDISDEAQVYGNALIIDGSYVNEYSQIYGDALINASTVLGTTLVSGTAHLIRSIATDCRISAGILRHCSIMPGSEVTAKATNKTIQGKWC